MNGERSTVGMLVGVVVEDIFGELVYGDGCLSFSGKFSRTASQKEHEREAGVFLFRDQRTRQT